MNRPRSFIWQPQLVGPPMPQIVFDDPRVGSLEITPRVEIALDPSDTRSLRQLAQDYPRPLEQEVICKSMS